MHFKLKLLGIFATSLAGLAAFTLLSSSIAYAEVDTVVCPMAVHPEISSPFGPRSSGYHYGIDLGVPEGTPVYASESGQSNALDNPGGYGIWIQLIGSRHSYHYGHLGQIVKTGSVNAGDLIAYSDTTGNAADSGFPHLHWEVHTPAGGGNETAVDPAPYWDMDSSDGKTCVNPGSGGGNPPPPPPTSGGTNPSGTDCHHYVLQYDPNNYYPCVQHLQHDLNDTGLYSLDTDGYFGQHTKDAVSDFQGRHSLTRTGTADAPFWCAIHTDFCAQGGGKINGVQGRVWRDDNGNGAQDNGEPLIGSCGGGLNVNATVTAGGQTHGEDVCNPGPLYKIETDTGSQTVTVNPPSGWSSTNGSSRTATVNYNNFTDVGPWFGIRPNSTTSTGSQGVQGRVFNDANGNGSYEFGEQIIQNPAGACGNYLTLGATVSAANSTGYLNVCNPDPLYKIATASGTQTATLNVPSGWSSTNGTQRTVTVQPGTYYSMTYAQWFGIIKSSTTPPPPPVTPPPPAPVAPAPTTPPPFPFATTIFARPIVGVESGKCLDAIGGGAASGTKVQLYDCNGTSAQKWTLLPDGSIRYGNLTSCLDIPGGNFTNGNQVQIYTCNNTLSQRWYRISDQTIRSASGKCLDAYRSGTANGTPVVIWDCGSTNNQKWKVQ